MNNNLLEKYKITKIGLLCKSNYGLIYKAISDIYGLIIIKINKDSNNYNYSCKYYNQFDNLSLCKMYAHEDDKKLQILEFVKGNNLFSVSDFNSRIKLGYNYLHNWSNNVKHTDDEEISFEHKVINIINELDRMNLSNKATNVKKAFLSIAKDFFKKYDNTYLIHGDLHHYNLIYDGSNVVAIDLSPQVASFAIEVAKFIENELFINIENLDETLDSVLNLFKFDIISEKELLEGLFIDSCYRTFDSLIESGETLDFNKGLYMNEKIYEYIKKR